MTLEISEDRRSRAIKAGLPDADAADDRGRLVTRVWIATGIAFTGGLVLTGLDLVTSHMPNYAIYAAACYAATAVGVSLLGVDRLLADREEFYRRGQLDGWMRGWRGQEPETGDPLRH